MFPVGGGIHRCASSREGLGAPGRGRCYSLSPGHLAGGCPHAGTCEGQPADHGRRVRPEAVLWGGPGPCSGLQQVSSSELVCRSCLKTTLHKLEGMMRILQAETTEGTVTPTTIADSILNITGVGPCLPPPPSLLQPAPAVPTSCFHLQATSSTWPAQMCRASSPRSWGPSRPH